MRRFRTPVKDLGHLKMPAMMEFRIPARCLGHLEMPLDWVIPNTSRDLCHHKIPANEAIPLYCSILNTRKNAGKLGNFEQRDLNNLKVPSDPDEVIPNTRTGSGSPRNRLGDSEDSQESGSPKNTRKRGNSEHPHGIQVT